MERKYLGVAVVAIGIVVVLLLGGYFAMTRYGGASVVEEGDNNNQKNEQQNENIKDEPRVEEGVKNIPLPEGYQSLDRSHSSYTKEQDQKQGEEFAKRLEMIQKTPTSVWAWIELGGIKYGFYDNRGAEAAWIHATKLAPTHTPAHANLAELYWHRLKDYPKAEAEMKKVIEIDKTYVAMYRNLADLYRYDYLEKAALADDVLKDGIAQLPTEHDLLAHLAYYYVDMEDWTNAVAYLEKLAAARKGDQQIIDDLVSARKKLAGQ